MSVSLKDLPPLLRTPRVELRAPVESDAEPMRQAIADSLERCAPQLGWALQLLERGGPVPDMGPSVRAAIARFEEGEEPGWYLWLTGAPTTLLGQLLVRRTGTSRVELGGWIRTGHQGHGYLEEACRAVIPLLRERGATGLVANCQPGYASTARLVQRAGFRLDALRDGRAFYVLDFD